MDKSGIAEQGTHAELIARDGWYAEMARLQAVGSEPDLQPTVIRHVVKLGTVARVG